MPSDIGTLEIVIRNLEVGEADNISLSKKRANSEGAYRRAQELHGDLQDNKNTFSDWKEPKPRHTHHAEYVITKEYELIISTKSLSCLQNDPKGWLDMGPPSSTTQCGVKPSSPRREKRRRPIYFLLYVAG